MSSNKNSSDIDQATGRWTITPQTPEETDIIALFKQAGVQAHEIKRLDSGEIVTNASGAKKLAALASDQALAAEFVAFCGRIAHPPAKV